MVYSGTTRWLSSPILKISPILHQATALFTSLKLSSTSNLFQNINFSTSKYKAVSNEKNIQLTLMLMTS